MFENHHLSIKEYQIDSGKDSSLKESIHKVLTKNGIPTKSPENLDFKFSEKEYLINFKQKEFIAFVREIETETETYKGYKRKSYVIKIEGGSSNNFGIFFFDIHRKNNMKIEEVSNIIDNSIIDVNLEGISPKEYNDLKQSSFSKDKPICFTSFNACFNTLNYFQSADPEDSVICDFLSCSAINYIICKIGEQSGYVRGVRGYIGDVNCSVVYNEFGIPIN